MSSHFFSRKYFEKLRTDQGKGRRLTIILLRLALSSLLPIPNGPSHKLDIFLGKHACPTLLQPLSFFMGPWRLHAIWAVPLDTSCGEMGSFQCTKTRFDSGITLTSDESTAASFVNLCLELFVSKSGSKQTRLGGPCRALPFYVDIFGRRIKFVLSSFGVCWTSVLSKGILVIS